MKWPTTLILLAAIASVTMLGVFDKVDSAAITSILGTVVGAVGVGHYVKTTLNGQATSTIELEKAARGSASPAPPTITDAGP